MNPISTPHTRRQFARFSSAALAGLAPLTASLPRSVHAAGTDRIHVGVIGCGNRGTGAAIDCLNADPAVEIVAAAEPLRDRLDGFLGKLDAWAKTNAAPGRVRLTPESAHVGFDGYRKLLATDGIDLVIVTSPVAFHPLHLEASVAAGKHTFLEKPAAVDPVGARRVIAAGEQAARKGLAVGVGTQRRHDPVYLDNLRAVREGAIGEIRSGRIWWCGGDARRKLEERLPGESDAQFMVRNWYHFTELCGDHIVEQHVHNIDVANWFIGRPPQTALGFGARARRVLGNRYDFFTVDFDYGDDVTVHSMARQVNGCYQRVSEHIVGAKGSVWPGGKLIGDRRPRRAPDAVNPYVQEHADLIRSIRDGKPINGARHLAEASLAAVMGRISAYTGQIVRWTDLAERADSPHYNLALKPAPEDFETGRVTLPPMGVAPLPGKGDA